MSSYVLLIVLHTCRIGLLPLFKKSYRRPCRYSTGWVGYNGYGFGHSGSSSRRCYNYIGSRLAFGSVSTKIRIFYTLIFEPNTFSLNAWNCYSILRNIMPLFEIELVQFESICALPKMQNDNLIAYTKFFPYRLLVIYRFSLIYAWFS